MNFSDNLKKIRKENNLSQEQIAEKLGVSRQSVSKWESGQAYPEMDKMVKLCQLFNLNIDDLLNQDIKEVNNNKQAKNNINKFIDDFLDYITKTIDMFSSMKFKQKVKCLFEQAIIIGVIILILLILGSIGSSILFSLFSFIPDNIYYPIYHIFSALYLVFCLILGTILVFHIFKVRYLDYYVIVKEKESDNEINPINMNEEKLLDNEENKKVENNKIFLEKRKEKIVIRDPEHSEYKFISGLFRCLLFILKMIAGFVTFLFCFTFVILVICLVLSFVFIKTGMMFIGVLLGIISSIIVNVIILNILYNFIVSNKLKKSKLAIWFISALILLGLGIGIGMIGITEFDIVNDFDSDYYTETEKILTMESNLFFEDYYNSIEYIESDNNDIKVVIKSSVINNVDIYKHRNGYYFHYYISSENLMKNIRQNIKDINDKKIIDYSHYKISIYTTKENIEVLKQNRINYYEKQEKNQHQEIINEYESRINELEDDLCELDPNRCY